MYLLDTYVISEMRKMSKGDARVWAWARATPTATTRLSAVTVMEIELGILRLERRDPRQGQILRDWLEQRVLPDFAGLILPIDEAVARRCATLHVPNPQPDRDAYIAATAIVHGMTVVTRNVADFAPTGVRIFNPWA